MSNNLSIRRAVRCALLASAAVAVVAPAQAQDPNPSIQEVVVTGSRIAQPNLTSISPVTSISAEAVKIEGITRIEDLINNLPQAFADLGGNISNGATGTATVNLRNLGPQRTLVLVNNRRLMPGDPTQNGAASPDLNQIPSSLIERVEVLTGGASAVYGADAVAGVVNFIMNDNFEGVRVDAQYSLYQHNSHSDIANLVRARNFELPESNIMDGQTRDLTFVAGINTPDGRGNATVYLGYRTLSEIRQDARDFSACTLAIPANAPNNPFNCGGSGTSGISRFIIGSGNPANGPGNGDFALDPSGALRAWAATDQFNFAPDNYYQRPDERKTAGLFAHYDLSEKASVYTDFMFIDDRTQAQIAASGAFLGAGPGQPPFFGDQILNCDNPLFPQQMVDVLCGGDRNAGDVLATVGRRNTEGGGRLDDLRHTSFRGVVGLRGDITDNWHYDVYGLYGTSILAENYQNDFSRARLGRALNAVTDNRAGSTTFGQVVCRINADDVLTNDDPRCVPYNIFQPGRVTPEQLAYLQIPGVSEGSTTEQVLSASISGDLGVKLPTATDTLGVAFGAEYRAERSELRTDQAFQTGDLAGQGAPTLDTLGSFNVRELFAEARLPLIQNKPFAQSVSLETGYRYSDYDLDFQTDTYKLGLDWSPVEDIRLRASYQRAVRSPNIQELFLRPRVQLAFNGDPCASGTVGTAPRGVTEEQCARTGVKPGQFGNILANPANQYNGLIGGNPDVQPEESDTYSYGLVLTPRFVPGLSISLDYFDITVDQRIGIIGGNFILNSCITSNQFCDQIHRDANGSLWLGDVGFVEDQIRNTGSQQIKGIDLEANYRLEIGRMGSLGFNAVGSYVDTFLTEPLPGAQKYDCVGLYGTVCGTPIPQWRNKLRTTWQTPLGLDVALTWRYTDTVELDATSSNPALSSTVFFKDRKMGSRSYFDVSASYSVSDFSMFSNLTGRLGINNVLDKDPPLISQNSCPGTLCNGNTFPQVYDTLGRYVFMGITADF